MLIFSFTWFFLLTFTTQFHLRCVPKSDVGAAKGLASKLATFLQAVRKPKWMTKLLLLLALLANTAGNSTPRILMLQIKTLWLIHSTVSILYSILIHREAILDCELEVTGVSLFFWDKNPNLACSSDDAANCFVRVSFCASYSCIYMNMINSTLCNKGLKAVLAWLGLNILMVHNSLTVPLKKQQQQQKHGIICRQPEPKKRLLIGCLTRQNV